MLKEGLYKLYSEINDSAYKKGSTLGGKLIEPQEDRAACVALSTLDRIERRMIGVGVYTSPRIKEKPIDPEKLLREIRQIASINYRQRFKAGKKGCR